MGSVLRPNRVKQAIQEGRPAFGIYLRVPNPTMVELAGYAGFDFVRIDTHHAFPNLETLENMIRAADAVGISPFVRTAIDRDLILAVLDMGAHGLVIPHCKSAADARQVVEYSKYAPLGDRGMYTAGRPGAYGAVSGSEYLKWARENIIVSVQLEDKEAYDELDEIANVDGLDMLQCGRGDLGTSLGVDRGENPMSLVYEYEARMVDAAHRAGKPASVNYYPTSEDGIRRLKEWVKKGVECISLGSDTIVIRHRFESALKDIKSVLAG